MGTDSNRHTGNFILILIAMTLGVIIGVMTASNIARHTETSLTDKIGEVGHLIEKEYVDEMAMDTLAERLIGVMLSELDPHSSYFSAHEAERHAEMMRGSFEGIGVVLHYEGDSCYVGQVMPGGPSDGVGLLPGDKILFADGDTISGKAMPNDSVVARLRGPRGTHVRVDIERIAGKATERLQFNIRRGVVEHYTVDCATMLDDTTGYIQLTTFAATSHDEFREALLRLKQKGMRHLVFDLRGNTGGSLASAIGIAGEMLPRGSLIVYTQGAHSRRQDGKAGYGGLFTEGRVTVMVDENSASASEVVAGALQDNDRATIVGRRTFGKGLVQAEYDLHDGSTVLLTVARYYTPSGRCIQRSYQKGTEAYYREYLAQLMGEAYADTMEVHIADTTPYFTRSGRVVYGGGGIVPDRLLAYHKDPSFVYYNALAGKSLISRVAFGEVRRHGAEWRQQYRDADAFIRQFNAGEAMMAKLVAEGEAAGIACDKESLRVQDKLFRNMLKAHIAFSLYGSEAYRRVCLLTDEDLQQLKTKQP
ncbi:MAG: PDZ domain-containing protein [Bacteroidales bacterium]|nr:PDZ domain-containing protein [Bacteroidales bacterium]